MVRQLKTVLMGYGVREGGKVRKGGRERVARDQLTPLIRSEGGGQTAKQCLVSNCTHDMYSTPVDLSFFYLGSAVEASLDTKNVQMEPNSCGSGIRCLFDPWIRDRLKMNIPDHITESLETIFGLKILKFFDFFDGIWIWDPESF